MKISSRFTIAVHTMVAISVFGGDHKMTSDFIAASVNVNPVIIRRTLLSLKAAGLIEVKAGSGGAFIVKDPHVITLYDIFRAVDSVQDSLFHFHENPNSNCPVGKNIHRLLDAHLNEAQRALEASLKKVTLASLVAEFEQFKD